MLECADEVRHYARENGLDERVVLNVDKGFDWNQLQQTGANLSLFSSRRLIELRLGSQKPGREGSAALVDYCKDIDPDNVLLVTSDKIDKQGQNSKWYKTLEKAGTTILIWPVAASQLQSWIVNRAKNQGKQISREAANLIADKVEGNLLAAKQEIEKLCLLVEKSEIDIKEVMEAVSDSTRFDIFDLIEFTLQGKTDRTIRMLRGLKSEGVEPISIFGALMWEFRRICSMSHAIDNGTAREKVFADYRVWPQRKPAITALLQRLNTQSLTECLRQANLVDKSLKGHLMADPWDLLEIFMFRIAGVRLQSQSEIV